MFYDLHIHSALSPCSDDDMTINNIVNMACLKGLDCIAITDHNSVKQLQFLDDIAKDKIHYVYGVEIQTREEVHVLGYFLKRSSLERVQSFLDKFLIVEPNDSQYFGHQYIFNRYDQLVNEEERLLIKSLNLSLKEVIDSIHQLNGIVVLAHVFNERFSIMHVYRCIDESLDIDGIEVKTIAQKEILIKKHPFLKDRMWFINSDAHRLDMIQEPIYSIDENQFYDLWRK